jgi:hypothetical protein
MVKGQKKGNYNLFPGGLTPTAFIVKQDTIDGRNTNSATNLKRKARGR